MRVRNCADVAPQRLQTWFPMSHLLTACALTGLAMTSVLQATETTRWHELSDMPIDR
jgi:hypothetical protein